ncbi:MAG: hypothetical protein Q4G60_02340 [bacterium]|nr:hypothetical protein [bacterium]
MPLREEEEDVDEEQEAPKKKKLFGKKKKNNDAGETTELPPVQNEPYDEAESEEEGGSLSIVLITFFIVLIWLAILGLLIKLDVGGFGSSVLRPILKDVPVVRMILPEQTDAEVAQEADFKTLEEALAEIDRLNKELEQVKLAGENTNTTDQENQIQTLKDEVKRLQTFEDNQIEFQKLKTQFYEEVVFADNAPDISEYKAYYESIDPATAEYLYKQVVQQIEEDALLKDYVQAYSQMKPKQAAAIFEQMPDNLELTAKILKAMDPLDRSKILGAMDAALASKITKIMDPEN